MVKLLEIINPIFREYSAPLKQSGLNLDLDIKNPVLEVKTPEIIEFEVKKYLEWTSSQGKKQGSVVISDSANQITIHDDSTVLTPEEKQMFASDATSVKSRVGFGTTFSINI